MTSANIFVSWGGVCVCVQGAGRWASAGWVCATRWPAHAPHVAQERRPGQLSNGQGTIAAILLQTLHLIDNKQL